MGIEENKAIIKRYFDEVYNEGNLDVIDEIISPDFEYHSPIGGYKGSEAMKQNLTFSRNAFPDMHVTVNQIFAEGDWVGVRWTMTGTHKGDFHGIPPTGNTFEMEWASFCRLEDGKGVEVYNFTDSLSFFRQLGVTPPTPTN